MNPSQVIREWELKHLPFSVANGEIGVNGKVNRSVIVSRYTSQIERMFNTQVRSQLSVNIYFHISNPHFSSQSENRAES